VTNVNVLGRVVTHAAGVVAVGCELAYEPADPWAVRLTLWPESPEPVTWVFARDLLAEGCRRAVNPGGGVAVSPDVTGELGGPWVRIDLVNVHEGRHAVVLLPRRSVDFFVCRTERLVPIGTEGRQVDWDRALRAWTSGGTGEGRAA
jgi:hypothetical protein